MITSTENKQYAHRAQIFAAKVQAYNALLSAHAMPFSIDLATVLTQYRATLFAPLLVADKGLKMRWEMLKTDAARAALIDATIDLDGHEFVPAVTNALAELRTMYERQAHNWGVSMYTYAQFALQYQLDVQAALDEQTVDLSDKQDVVAFLTQYRALLEQVRSVFVAAEYINTSPGVRDAAMVVLSAYDHEGKVKEMAAWQLANELTHKGKRDIIPKL